MADDFVKFGQDVAALPAPEQGPCITAAFTASTQIQGTTPQAAANTAAQAAKANPAVAQAASTALSQASGQNVTPEDVSVLEACSLSTCQLPALLVGCPGANDNGKAARLLCLSSRAQGQQMCAICIFGAGL